VDVKPLTGFALLVFGKTLRAVGDGEFAADERSGLHEGASVRIGGDLSVIRKRA
jgi:hypothetical protein